MAQKFLQAKKTKLAGSGITATATSIILDFFTTPDGIEIETASLGTTNYGTLEPGTDKEEIISFTGVTQNVDGTATLTGVTRGLQFTTPYTADSALRLSHAGGTIFVVSNNPQMYEDMASNVNDETIVGKFTFPGGGDANAPVSGTVYGEPTDDLEYASKKYVDDIAIAGSPKATEATYGIAKLSSAAADPTAPVVVNNEEVSATGGTGAGENKIVKANADGYLDDSFIELETTNPGLEFNTNKLDVKVKTAGGIVKDSDGLSVDTGTTDGKIVAMTTGDKLPAVDGSNLTNVISYSNGTATKDASEDSTTQNIAHGLGRIPRKIKITAFYTLAWSYAYLPAISMTVYNGTTQSSVSRYGANPNFVTGTSFILNIDTNADTQTGVITFDATNIIITWTKSGTPLGVYTLLWEAE